MFGTFISSSRRVLGISNGFVTLGPRTVKVSSMVSYNTVYSVSRQKSATMTSISSLLAVPP